MAYDHATFALDLDLRNIFLMLLRFMGNRRD